MKTKRLMIAVLGISTLAVLPAMAGVGIGVQINVPAPVVTIPAPVVPAPVVTVGVPDTYVWDGTEYVGVVGTDYFYLGPGDVWLPLDGPRIARFHDWERVHTDWRAHAIHNDRYRGDAHARHGDSLHDDHAIRDSHDSHGDIQSHDVGRDFDHDRH
jgi:hypothetical protein